MTRRNYLLALVAALVVGTSVRAQDSHVEVRYHKDSDVTVVTSDVLYAVNMPAQFLQVQMIGRYRKQGKPAEAPMSISLQFFSYAPKPLYQLDDSHRLRVKADEEILDFGLMIYSKLDEKYEASDGTFRTNTAARAGLPANALVRSTSKSDGLTLEVMSARNLSLADLRKLAKANGVVVKIGSTVFPLKPMHMTIVRQFVEAITPANVNSIAVKELPKPIDTRDVPSEANRASLEVTLNWLKALMDKEGETNTDVVPTRLETLKFKDCSISYRVIPLFRNSPVSNSLFYSIMEYEINLGDLNPEIVTVSKYRDNAKVFLTTRDVQEKIRVVERANDRPNTVRTLNNTRSARVSISLKSFEAASRFTVALSHAIKLCTR